MQVRHLDLHNLPRRLSSLWVVKMDEKLQRLRRQAFGEGDPDAKDHYIHCLEQLLAGKELPKRWIYHYIPERADLAFHSQSFLTKRLAQRDAAGMFLEMTKGNICDIDSEGVYHDYKMMFDAGEYQEMIDKWINEWSEMEEIRFSEV